MFGKVLCMPLNFKWGYAWSIFFWIFTCPSIKCIWSPYILYHLFAQDKGIKKLFDTIAEYREMWEKHGQEWDNWESPKSARLDADCYLPSEGPSTTPSPEPSVQKSEGDKKGPAGHEATPETKYVGEFLYDTPQQGDVVLSEEQQLELEKVLLDIQALEDPQNLVATPNSEVSGPQLLSIICSVTVEHFELLIPAAPQLQLSDRNVLRQTGSPQAPSEVQKSDLVATTHSVSVYMC